MTSNAPALTPQGPNAEQIERWNVTSGVKWARNRVIIERFMAQIGAHLMAAAAPQPGETVLDIGCGAGGTSCAAAQAVGPQGKVMGVDVSAPMLEQARAARGTLPIEFILADATDYPLPQGHFDLALSRFGVMFFADPIAAFTNIRRALKPGGRLAFVCWQSVKLNSWVTVPLNAALAHVPPPEKLPPGAPGPFAFADAERTQHILSSAGFRNIAITPMTLPAPIAPPGPDSLDEATYFVSEIGPVSGVLELADEGPREKARDAIRVALAPLVSDKGVVLEAACWFVGARV